MCAIGTLRFRLARLLIPLIGGCLLAGCLQPSGRCAKFTFLDNFNIEERREAFLALTPEEQVDAFQCAMSMEPAYSDDVAFLAENCDETVPIIAARLKEEQHEMKVSDLMTALMLMSSQCNPPIEIRKAALEAAEAAATSMPQSSIWKENAAETVRIIKHYWNASSRQHGL